MLMVVDIGNTNMEFGMFEGERLARSFRLSTNRNITSDEVGIYAVQYFQINGLRIEDVEDVIISSVVPQVMYSITNAIRKYFHKNALVVGENVTVPIENRYDNPKEVGADRLITALAAYKKVQGPVIVVDFGTATTFDAVDRDGAYLGGAIYPGIKISMEALFQKAAKLPRVEIANPGVVIGKNTVQSMQAGVLHGYVGSVKYMVELMKKDLGEDTKVIGTGGLANLIGTEAGVFWSVEKALPLDGLRLIYEAHKAASH